MNGDVEDVFSPDWDARELCRVRSDDVRTAAKCVGDNLPAHINDAHDCLCACSHWLLLVWLRLVCLRLVWLLLVWLLLVFVLGLPRKRLHFWCVVLFEEVVLVRCRVSTLLFLDCLLFHAFVGLAQVPL